MRFAKPSHWGLVACSLVACTPALNWRDVQPAGSGVTALFPCKPEHFARKVLLADMQVQMEMFSCSAAGATYALSHVELRDPLKVQAVLTELREVAARNLGATAHSAVPMAVSGMTPSRLAERLTIEGRRADGHVMHEQAAFFAKGPHVYQAAIVGERLDAEAADTFFTGLKLAS